MAKKKKLGALATRISERQFIGPEPSITGIATRSNLVNYYNWCNTRYELKDAKKFLIKYLEENKQDVRAIDDLPDYHFVTIGFTARFLSAGGGLPVDAMERFKSKISALYDRSPNTEPSVKRTPMKTVSDKIHDECNFLDRLYDQVLDKKEFDQETLETMKNGIVTKQVASIMLPRYNKELAEMEVALSGKDPELAEGYLQYSKKDLRSLTNEIASFIKELVKLTVSTEKVVRVQHNPRMKKVKPPEKQVKSLQFNPKDDKYNIKSIDPRQIVGAMELWLFNVEYRKITVLRAVDEKGLSVKGTTVLGFDEKTSFTKRIRKPEDVIPQIMNGGKLSAKKTFEAVKTMQDTAKGRVGSDTLLMKVFK